MGMHAKTEHFVLMKVLGENLKRRARELRLTDAAVARRVGIDPHRYGYYSLGQHDPDPALLIKIAEALLTTPNALLGIVEPSHDPRLSRFLAVCAYLDDSQIDTVTALAETLATKNNAG